MSQSVTLIELLTSVHFFLDTLNLNTSCIGIWFAENLNPIGFVCRRQESQLTDPPMLEGSHFLCLGGSQTPQLFFDVGPESVYQNTLGQQQPLCCTVWQP